MGVTRTALKFETDFTRIPNEWARDERLSRRARGLLVEIMSHRVGWHITTRSLASAGKEGRDAIRGALTELLEHGYLRRVQGRSQAGTFGEVEYELCDPATVAGFADRGSAVAGSAVAGESDHKEEHQEEEHQEELVLDGLEVPPAAVTFDQFYFVYPRKVGRAAAQRAWERAVRSVAPEVIVAGARRYAQDPNLPEKRFIPHPATWLNQGRWDDEPEAPREQQGPVVSPGDEWLEDRA